MVVKGKGIEMMEQYLVKGKESLKDAIEGYIDSTNPAAILDLVSNIFYEKSEHVQSTWLDEQLAYHWDQLARKVDNLQVDIFYEWNLFMRDGVK